MKKLLLVATVALLSTSIFANDDHGKMVFEQNKCTMCHQVKAASVGTKGKDISKLGISAADLEKYLMKESKINGKMHMKKFAGSAEDLKAMSEWLIKY
jgi:cytochrome c551/c552